MFCSTEYLVNDHFEIEYIFKDQCFTNVKLVTGSRIWDFRTIIAINSHLNVKQLRSDSNKVKN